MTAGCDPWPRPGGAGGPLDWDVDGRDWPHREASRFREAGGLRWHLQEFGQGPTLLLVHGTGASTHTWRDLATILARHFTVVAPDLPGHGFSQRAQGTSSLPGMAGALAALLRARAGAPVELAVGHSAGAAILCRMCLDGAIAPRGLVSLNGAFLPLGGAAGRLFPGMARLLFGNPLVPWLLAKRAELLPRAPERVLRGTGSRIDPEGLRLYARLMRSPQHLLGTFEMMAHWDLAPLVRALPALEAELLLIVGGRDRYIAPAQADRIRERVPRADVARYPALGHLAHEERPREIARRILAFARACNATHAPSEPI